MYFYAKTLIKSKKKHFQNISISCTIPGNIFPSQNLHVLSAHKFYKIFKMKKYLKDKCKESPSKKQYFVPETQEPPDSPIFKGENWRPHPDSPSSSSGGIK